MRITLAIAVLLAACGGGTRSRTAYYAVGATHYWASPTTCTIHDNDGGVLVALPDHYKAKDGQGLVFEAKKPGKARIECKDGNNGSMIEVREAVKVELRRIDDANTPFPTGSYAPMFCLTPFDKDGKQLELGSLVDGTELQWSEHVRRVGGHPLFDSNPACTPEGMGHIEGKGTVTGTWKTFTAKAEFEVKGKSP